MSERKNRIPAGMKRISVTVPIYVADFFDTRATNYGGSVSAAAGPVLCAFARGEIRQDFTQQPGTDTRPR